MKKNTILFFLIVIILAGAGIWYLSGQKESSPSAVAPAGETAASSTPPVAQAVYNCAGGKTIAATFYEGEQKTAAPGQPTVPTGSVKIVLSDGRNFDLAQTISADGGRYANRDESFVFWDKGDTALVLESGAEKDFKDCVAAGAAAGQELKVISPNGGESWSQGQKVQITWGKGQGIKTVNIRLSISGKEDGQSFNAAIASGVENTGNYEWTVQEILSEAMGVKGLPVSNYYLLTVEDSEHNNIYDMSDATFSIGKSAGACINGQFTNVAGGYSFACFPEWNFAITKKDAPQTDSLFGPGATETAGNGGVEIRDAKSIADFLSSTGAAITDKRNITINGVGGVRDHYAGFPQKGEQAVFYKDGKIFNIYLGTDSRGSDLSANDIGFFDRIVNSFAFIK